MKSSELKFVVELESIQVDETGASLKGKPRTLWSAVTLLEQKLGGYTCFEKRGSRRVQTKSILSGIVDGGSTPNRPGYCVPGRKRKRRKEDGTNGKYVEFI